MNSNKIYQHWLNSSHVSKNLKEQMLKMSDEEISIAFRDEPLKFGTAGYRAIYGPGPMYLNEHTYQQLTIAYAKFLIEENKNREDNLRLRVFIGHDNRKDGKSIATLIANILSSFGIQVFLVKNNWLIATPIVSFIIRHLKLDGAINVTASHNPKEYNGFKAYNATGAQVNEEQAKLISSFLPDNINNLNKKFIPRHELINFLGDEVFEDYYESIDQEINLTKYKNYKDPIVITTHHGAGSIYAPDYLESLGHNIVPVKEQCYEDPEFSNSPNMNPEDPISFKASIDLAEKIKSNLCIGFDPDADRMAVAVKHDNQWFFLNGNEMGILASYYLLKHKKLGDRVPVLVSTFVSNDLIDRIADGFNGLVVRTATGFKNIAQAMDMIDPAISSYIIGFEEAVGMNFSLATREKDGIAAAALVLEMYNFYKQQNQTLVSVLWNRIYQIYGQWFGKTVSIKIPSTNWKQVAEQLKENVLQVPADTILDRNFRIESTNFNTEGNCIEWFLNNNSWIKFRISGTEPKFKIYFNLYFDSDNFEYDYYKYESIVEKLTKIIEEKIFK